MKKISTLEKIIRNIQDVGIGGVTSYITISRDLGWKTHCGRMLQKDIISVKPEVFEKFRDGRQSKIKIVSDPMVLDEILAEKESAKKNKNKKITKMKTVTTGKTTKESKPKKSKKTKKEKVEKVDDTILDTEAVQEMDGLMDDVTELETAYQSTFEEQLNDDDFFNS